MKVIFLDFDGVLNSSASFLMESRKRKKWKEKHPDLHSDDSPYMPTNQTFSEVCASNFQYVLDKCPDAKIVFSTTWRNLYSMDWLKEQLESYGIDSSRVIDKTPNILRGFSSAPRGQEICEWLDAHPEVTHYAIIDDNSLGEGKNAHKKNFVKTSWLDGLTLGHATQVIGLLGGDPSGGGLPL